MTNFDQWLARKLEDPEFREAYDTLEPAHQIVCLRIRRGLTQTELAERTGSSQSSIARVEAGGTVPTIDLLRRVAKALDAKLVIRFVPNEGAPDAEWPSAEETVPQGQEA